MRFTVTLYLSLEADSEDEARKIVDTIELHSTDSEHSLNVMATEVEEVPGL
jgi:hypothetical protein